MLDRQHITTSFLQPGELNAILYIQTEILFALLILFAVTLTIFVITKSTDIQTFPFYCKITRHKSELPEIYLDRKMKVAIFTACVNSYTTVSCDIM